MASGGLGEGAGTRDSGRRASAVWSQGSGFRVQGSGFRVVTFHAKTCFFSSIRFDVANFISKHSKFVNIVQGNLLHITIFISNIKVNV